jgi:hypothetical protein
MANFATAGRCCDRRHNHIHSHNNNNNSRHGMLLLWMTCSLLLIFGPTIQCFRSIQHVSAFSVSSSSSALFFSRSDRNHHPSRTPVVGGSNNIILPFTFDDMKKLDQRLVTLEEESPNFLWDYYEPHLTSFSVAPGTAETLSITSTSYCIRALLEYPQRSWEYTSSTSTGSTTSTGLPTNDRMVRSLLNSNWRERDLYQVSLLLVILLRIDPTLSIIHHAGTNYIQKFAKLVSLVLSGRFKRRLGDNQQFSSYISYLCTSAYVDLQSCVQRNTISGQLQLGCIPMEELQLPSDTFKEITLAVSRSAELTLNEVCRQLAYRTAGDSGSFDVIKLVYSLLSYLKSTESTQGTAGREVTIIRDNTNENDNDDDITNVDDDDENVDSIRTGAPSEMGTGRLDDLDGRANSTIAATTTTSTTESVKKVNKRIVQAALEAFFQEQKDQDGLWDRGQPIYKSFHRQGRNVGNAYVFALDALGSLLEFLPPEEFRPYLSNLERALTWIEQNEDVEIIADYCDPQSGQCYGKALRGWASPHLSPPGGPKAWATAQTITCLARMRRIVQQLMHNDVLEEFGGVTLSKHGPNNQAWDRLLDSDLGEPGSTDRQTIKYVLENRVCQPFAQSVSAPSVGAAYSTILFGSPGTAKTTITEAVAEKMGWDFVVIDTTAFLADGLTNVASRIRYVFTRLQALRNCVILFDEIEEFCLDRETPGISMESRMLTTAMLTAINDLRRTKQSVFFLATNRLRAFDAAIIRPGRFDMQLFVGTPNLQARIVLLEQALFSASSISSSGSGLSFETKKKVAMDTYIRFLETEWERDAMFMNYLECKQFATSASKIIMDSNRTLEMEELQTILSKQAAVMTARGPVREEYIAQMGLSRL